MRIALPIEENETEICPSFGRTPMFMIYDTETQQTTILDNSGIQAQGGAGIKAAQVMIDEKVDVLLAPRCLHPDCIRLLSSLGCRGNRSECQISVRHSGCCSS